MSDVDWEVANEAKVNALQSLGVSLPLLQITAMQTRVEVLIDYLFDEDDVFTVGDRGNFERLYEQKLSEMLDGVYAEVTKPRLFTPDSK